MSQDDKSAKKAGLRKRLIVDYILQIAIQIEKSKINEDMRLVLSARVLQVALWLDNHEINITAITVVFIVIRLIVIAVSLFSKEG